MEVSGVLLVDEGFIFLFSKVFYYSTIQEFSSFFFWCFREWSICTVPTNGPRLMWRSRKRPSKHGVWIPMMHPWWCFLLEWRLPPQRPAPHLMCLQRIIYPLLEKPDQYCSHGQGFTSLWNEPHTSLCVCVCVCLWVCVSHLRIEVQLESLFVPDNSLGWKSAFLCDAQQEAADLFVCSVFYVPCSIRTKEDFIAASQGQTPQWWEELQQIGAGLRCSIGYML